MPAWVCRACSSLVPIGNMPPTGCPDCGSPMLYDPFKSITAPPEPELDEIPFLDAPLELRNGAAVIDSHELIRRGHHARLQPGSIYRVEVDGNEFFIEILDYSYTNRLYVVQQFSARAPDFVPEEWVKPKRPRKKKEA